MSTEADTAPPSRAGFVAIIGAPNVGKSTLLNALIGSKVSIVSPKVQTTRSRIIGIAMEGPSQIVFVDTPGIFAPRRRLDRAMVAAAWEGAQDADQVVLVIDAARPDSDDTRAIVERLKQGGRKAILVINKIDLVRRDRLLEIAAGYAAEGVFEETFMVSAAKADGVADLRRHLAARVPEGPHLYPEDQLTDLPQRLLAAEITREQVFLQLHDELPYAAAVETEAWQERDDGSVRIDQVIYVMRDSQKAIVLGKGGARIKTIGSRARVELERILDRKVHLFLFVKVREGWAEDPERYREWGLAYDS